jgi:cytochrome P450
MNRNQFCFALRPLHFLDSYAAGPHNVLDLGGSSARRLLIRHPNAIDWVFRSDRELQHPASETLSALLGPRSLLWADGSRHTAYRRALGPALRGHRLEAYRGTIAGTVHAALDALVPGAVFPLSQWTRQVTLRVMGQLLFDRVGDVLLQSFATWIENSLGSRHRTLAHRYLRRRRRRYDHKLDYALLAKAEAAADSPTTSLAALLRNVQELPSASDDRELRDQIVSLLFAGHETTASATAWTLYWLDRHDQVRQDVIAELAATSSDGSDATEVPLLHAVIQEALRLSPPATMTGKRLLPTGGELLGMSLPAGTVLNPCIYAAHRSPDFFRLPHRFDPGRFLDQRIPRGHYFPFGGGTRHCLGRDLAMLEVRMFVTAVLRRRSLRCVNPRAGVPQLRGAAMAPASSLRMRVRA